METNERQRRVGTFTLGVVLVVSGALMLASMFWPQLDWEWALKCSPLILIGLGVETLIAAKGGGKVKYDWVGMVLCFVLVCAGNPGRVPCAIQINRFQNFLKVLKS